LVVEREKTIIGGAAVIEVSVPWLDRGLAVIKFGPLWRSWNGTGGREAANEVVRSIKAFYCTQRRLHLSILPQAPVDDEFLIDGLKAAGFTLGGEIADPARYLINLTLSERDLRDSFAGRARRNLKSAESRGLTIEEGHGPAARENFMRIFEDLRRRKQQVDPSGLEGMWALDRSVHSSMRPRIFTAKLGDRSLAGIIVTAVGERAYYAFGAQTEEAAKISANYYLQWEVVKLLRREGKCRWYDLGGDGNNQGLVQFKTGFIGKAGRIVTVPARREFSESGISKMMAKGLFRLADVSI
jgi:hypothetical protein